jgi:hypothetical protein
MMAAQVMRTPWHLWVVGFLSLLWNAGGGYDYVMARTGNASYVAMIPEGFRADFLAYLDAMPIWASTGWALGVWGSILGSVLILLRSRHALTAFYVSLAGLAVNSVYTYLLADTNLAMMAGTMAKLFTVGIVIVLILLTWYCHRQRSLGRLT